MRWVAGRQIHVPAYGLACLTCLETHFTRKGFELPYNSCFELKIKSILHFSVACNVGNIDQCPSPAVSAKPVYNQHAHGCSPCIASIPDEIFKGLEDWRSEPRFRSVV